MKTIPRILFGGASTNTRGSDAVLLITRFAFGAFMLIGHGWGKLNESGFDKLVKSTAGMGFPMPTIFAGAAVAAETIGAALVAIGLFTRPAAAILAFNMAVAAFLAHGRDPWFGRAPSKEMALVYFVPFLLFAIMGGGRYSIDRLVTGKLGSRRGA